MSKNTLIVPGISLERTFECGQAFRWRAAQDGAYCGVAGSRAASIAQKGDELIFSGADGDLAFWENYFALDQDYGALMAGFDKDEQLRPCLEHSAGIRVLRQEPFETLITFIISANNHVPRIRSIVERLCARYGEELGGGVFAFPSPGALANAAEADVVACGAGYRAPYIIKTARTILDGFDLGALTIMSEEQARKALTSLPGVGPKVAQCVMLFGLGFSDAFPVDVWMKRVLGWLYPELGEAQAVERCLERFRPLAGVAQQLLFHYAREVKLCK